MKKDKLSAVVVLAALVISCTNGVLHSSKQAPHPSSTDAKSVPRPAPGNAAKGGV